MFSPHRNRSLRFENLPAFLCGRISRFPAILCGAARLRPGSFRSPSPSAPLTMQQAVDYALAHNPTLLSSQQNLLSMKGQEVEAGLRQNPDFTVYTTNVTNPATSVTPYAYSLQMSRLFERGQKRRWRLDSAQATTSQTEAQFHDQQRGTVLAVKQAFTTMVLAKAALKVAQDNLTNYKQQLDIYRAGLPGRKHRQNRF